MKHTTYTLVFLIASALLATGCTVPRDPMSENSASGPGYAVDTRDTYTSDFRPLNGLPLGAPASPEAPLDKTIGTGKLDHN